MGAAAAPSRRDVRLATRKASHRCSPPIPFDEAMAESREQQEKHLEFVVDELLLESPTPRTERFKALCRELTMLAHGGAELGFHVERLLRVIPSFSDWRDATGVVRALGYHCDRSGDVATTRALLALDERLVQCFFQLDFREPFQPDVVRVVLEFAQDANPRVVRSTFALIGAVLYRTPDVSFLASSIPWLTSLLDRTPEGRGNQRIDLAWQAATTLHLYTHVESLRGEVLATLTRLVDGGDSKAVQDWARACLALCDVTWGRWEEAEQLMHVRGKALDMVTDLLVHAVNERLFFEKSNRSPRVLSQPPFVDLETFTRRMKDLFGEVRGRGSKPIQERCARGLEGIEKLETVSRSHPKER